MTCGVYQAPMCTAPADATTGDQNPATGCCNCSSTTNMGGNVNCVYGPKGNNKFKGCYHDSVESPTSRAMSKSLSIEYAKKNININCISPGFIKTVMTDKIDDKFKEAIISKIPSARLGEPDDIANAVLFLSSEQSNYINGETLHVNGGMYMA